MPFAEGRLFHRNAIGVKLMKQSSIYKIRSERLRKSKWQLVTDYEQFQANNEVVNLADSTLLRFVREINGIRPEQFQAQLAAIERQISELKLEDSSPANRRKLKQLHKALRSLLHISDLILITMNTAADFDRLNHSKGFTVDGVPFRRLLATAGGVKQKTVIYASEKVYGPLLKRIDNGRNSSLPIVPAKLEAYRALVSSASFPVPHPNGVLVVSDCITCFKEDVIRIFDEEGQTYPTIREESGYTITNNASDGFGLMSPELAQRWRANSGACLRNAYLKGMVFPFDFHAFAAEVAGSSEVTDVWGNKHDIGQIELVLTTSMLKLWNAYTSIDHYLTCCKENGYSFSLTKVTPERLENQRNLNYQFIQALELDDQDIAELTAPTVTMIKEITGGDYRKSILYLKGMDLAENEPLQFSHYDYVNALLIDERMADDPFVRNKIKSLIQKRTTDAMRGDLIVRGNFAIAAGDPYALCQSMFGMEVTGLLQAGQFYSRYWSDLGVERVACFRAPMSVANNIRMLHFHDTEQLRYWYRHMRTVNIFNAFDTTTHAQNGQDYDGDANLTTDNSVLLRVIKPLKPIICEQAFVEKIIPAEQHLIHANKRAFGDDIGKVTNRGTSLYDVLAKFQPGTAEHREVLYRIMCIQHYQQNAIDKTKGAESKPLPKEWYSMDANLAEDGDSEEMKAQKAFNRKLLADKKPYFFIYRYPETKKSYEQYIKRYDDNCIFNYGIKLKDMLGKPDKTDEEASFVHNYYHYMPVSLADSPMNRICRRMEQALSGMVREQGCTEAFDYRMMKTDKHYCPKQYQQLLKLYKAHNERMQIYMKISKLDHISEEEVKAQRQSFLDEFTAKAYELCSNAEDLTNMVLDICYQEIHTNKSKQFAWDLCGEPIIVRLLENHHYKVRYPVRDDHGDIHFQGERFRMIEKIMER
ncbi:hypothetical protein EBB07_06070 [Paenibacillaceae bacterium]|nr:hypothetical protein EBB07_06070 [Paenibacillaceae bacterium]